MNLEQELAAALHAAYGAVRPDPDLRLSVMTAIQWDRAARRHRRRDGLGALAGLAAVLLLAALAVSGASWLRTSPGPQATSSSGLAHYALGRVSLDYPSSWQFRLDVTSSVVAFWTGNGPSACIEATPGPNRYCGLQGGLLPGTLYVTAGRGEGSPVDSADATALPPGGQYSTVSGRAAIFSSRTAGSDLTLDWAIAEPKEPRTRWLIHAEIADPGAESMRSQVAAMVASLRFDRPGKPLGSQVMGEALAASWIAANHGLPGLECFPSGPGVIETASITDFPWSDGVREPSVLHVTSLSKPLPVSCDTTVQPAASVGLWKLTLREWWSAAADREAGSYTLVFWLDPDATGDEFNQGVGWGPDVVHGVLPYANPAP